MGVGPDSVRTANDILKKLKRDKEIKESKAEVLVERRQRESTLHKVKGGRRRRLSRRQSRLRRIRTMKNSKLIKSDHYKRSTWEPQSTTRL